MTKPAPEWSGHNTWALPNRSVRRGPLSHGTTLASLGTFSPAQAEVWARKIRAKVADPVYAGRTPEELLRGLGMDDPDGIAQVLEKLERLPE